MARKVFISFLGTGPANKGYDKVAYANKDSGFKSAKTPFIQQATLKLIEKVEGSFPDVVYILLTQKAKELNWQALKKRLAGMHVNSKTVEDLPEGKDEKEIAQIFKAIDDIIEDGDQIYLDITHGFRYMPIIMLIAAYSSIITKNVSIVHCSYGGFLSAENKVAPIVDLLPMIKLLEANNISKVAEAKTALMEKYSDSMIKILVVGAVAFDNPEPLLRKEIKTSKYEFEFVLKLGTDKLGNFLEKINQDYYDFIISGPVPHSVKGKDISSGLEAHCKTQGFKAKVFSNYNTPLSKSLLKQYANQISQILNK